MRTISSLLTSCALVLAACGGAPATADQAAGPAATPDGWVEADLSKAPNKLPIIVKAPADYTLDKGTMGEGVEVASEKLTFIVDDATALGDEVVASQKMGIKDNSGLVFEKFVLEQPDGFIAQMGGGSFIPYRLVAVGGRKYELTVIPLNALPSEESAKQFYDLAALARTK